MIIDGVKVLYTMRNGKIVDPNIPMDGLVCYLDTRGKYNTDVYRNTLLDLSGNGNHGTLQNFNFTEESGYVNDSSGGLKFDGVDDSVTLSNKIDGNSFTIYAKYKNRTGGPMFSEEEKRPYRLRWTLNYFLLYYEAGFTAASIYIPETVQEFIIRVNNGTIDYWLDGVKRTITYPLVKPDTDYEVDNGSVKPFYIGKNSAANLNGQVDKIMIYNRVLTDTEIQQLMEA